MKRIATVFFVLITSSQLSFGWGMIGHRVVGEIAQKNLSKKGLKEVQSLLGVETLSQVSNWPDFIKSNPEWRKANSWHYVSIPDGQTYKTIKKNKKGDIVEAIARFTKILKNKKNEKKERANALKFLVHFVGDLHQPLHAGYAHDRGGNSQKLKWFGKSTNLHSIWDTKLIKMQELSYTEYTDYINHATKKEVKKWQRDDIAVWIKESMGMRTQVYDIVKNAKKYSKYGEFKYSYNNIKSLNQRLLQAGIRLAGIINNI